MKAFVAQYGRISSLTQNREDRAMHKEICESLPAPIVEGPESNDFTRIELEQAIDKLKTNKEGGLDEIVPRLITNLPNTARERFLKIMNSSWNQGYIPKTWRRATIISILKKEKNAEKIEDLSA